jgi:hypothetical protein
MLCVIGWLLLLQPVLLLGAAAWVATVARL